MSDYTPTTNAEWRDSNCNTTISTSVDSHNVFVGTSTHNFEVFNRLNQKVSFQLEYQHVLWKKDHNGNYTTEVVRNNVPSQGFSVSRKKDAEYKRFDHIDNENKHGTEYVRRSTAQLVEGGEYKFECYTNVNPNRGESGDSIQKTAIRYFTVAG